MTTNRSRRGLVTGYVLKLARESIPARQQQLAEAIGVDRGTIQGWESGRRPFTSAPYGQAIALRHRLVQLGADPALLHAMTDAAEADFVLSEIVDTRPSDVLVDQHPLAYRVLTHGLAEMLSWPITGQAPTVIASCALRTPARRGPVADGPTLDAAEREAFFDGLRAAVVRATGDGDHAVLLHRQACFLSGLDPAGAVSSWLASTKQTDYFVRPREWSPRWADARSIATALARQGDVEPLRAFISNAHADETCEFASLNYWAYWVGEISERQHDDRFMVSRGLRWQGALLLRHLVERMTSQHGYVDLNVHTVWSLLAAKRGLLADDRALGADLYRRSEQLLDEGQVSEQSRQELTSVLYGLRMDGMNA